MGRILIRGGTIVDGTGAPRYCADVLVEDDRISKIGEIAVQPDMQCIDAAGLCVAPGFIDTHSHSDLDVLLRPAVLPKIMQGITTELLGQDGVSMAPLPKQYISSWRKNLAGLDGDTDDIDWGFETTENYLNMLENAHPGLNEAYLVPHGNIRMEAMGLDNRLPTDDEIDSMCRITRREMQAGAMGLSTGLIYIPCAYSESKEIIAMCKVVAEFDGVFVIHQRSEADTILDSMREVIEIGRKSGVKVHWSHFKVAGRKNWDKIDAVLELLETAKKEGITVSFDQYPYVAGSTMMGAILPPWVHDGGTDNVISRLKDPKLREKMRYDMENGLHGWDNFIDFAGFDNIYTTSVKTEKNADAVGLSLTEFAKKRGKDVYNSTFDLLMEEENAVGMVDFYGTEEHVKLFMQREEMNVCTDGLLCPGKPHPRLYGSFPRVLGKYARDEQVFSLETAVAKMTSKAASVLSLAQRGQIKEGFFADITSFDFNTILDKGTFTEPVQYPQGIHHVLVNGKIAVQNGKHTGTLNGKVIKHEGVYHE